MLESIPKCQQANITDWLLFYFNWKGFCDQCSWAWFSLKIENETFESDAILPDNLCAGLQDAHTEHSRNSSSLSLE